MANTHPKVSSYIMAPIRGEDPLQRLRRWRNRPDADLSLHFLASQFKKTVERPHKQLAQIAQLWEQYVPSNLASQTRLESFQRGILCVSTPSSAVLYQLHLLLKQGLEKTLIHHYSQGSLRTIKIRLEQGEKSSPRPPQHPNQTNQEMDE